LPSVGIRILGGFPDFAGPGRLLRNLLQLAFKFLCPAFPDLLLSKPKGWNEALAFYGFLVSKFICPPGVKLGLPHLTGFAKKMFAKMAYSITLLLTISYLLLLTFPWQAAAAPPEKTQPADVPPATDLHDLFKNIIRAPIPEYPYEARRHHLTGAGVAIVKIDPATGTVIRVIMYTSTGQPLLDRATMDALYRWQFRPGTPFKAVRVPITYSVEGGSWGIGVLKTESNMDNALARYLGKGTVISAPVPEYPGGRHGTSKRVVESTSYISPS